MSRAAQSARRSLPAWVLLPLLLVCALVPAAGRAATGTFDHFTTGFELLGQHRNVPCADCHVGGIFKGTPTDCFACHAAGSRIGATAKPTKHIISNNDCAQCHTPFGWSPVAQFNHLNVFGTCSSCHNNVQTVGKPANHIATTAECNQCHVVTKPWSALNYPLNHIPTSPTSICTNCHTGNDFSVVPSLTNIHLYAPSTSGNCAQCHGSAAPSFAIAANGFSVVGVPAAHVPIAPNAACESCHVGAGSSIAATPVVDGAKFSNSAMNHAGLTTCVGCHGPTITGATFTGIASIIVMPATAPMGATAHIPSATACETCHQASVPAGLVPGNATKTVPGTGFQMPAPTTAMIHAGITSGCNGCHEGADQWLDMTASYPLNPATLASLSTTQYMGFQTRPGKAASSTNLVDAAHPTTGDCSQCHTRTDYFEGQLKPSNHIPTSTTAQCTNCHTGTDFSVMPTLLNIHTYAPSTTTNCAQCHGSTVAAGFAIPAANFSIVTTPATHVPTTAACESCHVGAGSSVATTPVPNGAKFTNSAMNHAAITTCVSCHGPAVSPTAFYGVTRLIVMPATSPVGPASHIPSATGCESCHTAPSGLVPGSAVSTVPGTGFQTPAPTTAQIHTGITSGCASCHEGADQWLDMTANYPLNPATLSSVLTTQYMGFQTRPGKAASSTNLVDNAHPTSGDCSQCHSRTDYFEGQLKPANHIPTSATAQCTNCHTGTDFSVIPTLLNIHTYAPSTTTNCAQCHGPTVAAGFAIPAANFSIVTEPANHVPTTAACESCHVGAGSSVTSTPVPNGSKFTGSAMSHAGITTCVSCHGPTITGASFYGISTIIVMPATSPMGVSAHIPSATTCESCHLGSMPSAFVPANATKAIPGTLFQSPVPTTAMIHTGITSGCASCHEGAYQWLDMTAEYPLNPATLSAVTTTQYMGFQTRPGKAASSTNLVDNAHPTSGDCSQCHSRTDYFEGNIKPSNHIPTSATAVCSNCHTSADFSAIPTLLNIHTYAPSTTANCARCHGPAVAAGFAIPAANFSIVTEPANHVPTTAACESCHVGAGSSVTTTPVPNGSKFTGSAMSHAGITTCVSCHGPTITGASFYGITSIVVMPPSSPVGMSSHIPSVTTCESCHVGSMPSGFVPANATKTAPGTAFATPIPTTAMIHGGVTSGCASCHEASYVWMDVADYPISPTTVTGLTTTQYIGFQTRPGAVASTYSVADAAHPATGDCSNCHSGTNYFSAQAEPSNHIPTNPGAPCADCHTTAGNFAVYTSNLTTLHTDVPTTCSTCHADGKGPFAGATGFAIVQMSTRGLHIPITNAGLPVECSGCHKSVTAFTGTIMSHAAIGDNANSAAGDACDACHEYGYRSKFYGVSISFTRDSPSHHICGAAGTPTAPNVTICATGGGSDCLVGCHQHNNIPSQYATVKPGTPKKLIQSALTPSAVAGAVTPASGSTRPATLGSPMSRRLDATGGRFDHATLAGQTCQSCHNGTAAAGKPAAHIASGNDCDRCHTTSAWTPAVFDHSAVVAGTCASCHNALQATGKPASHVATQLSCDSCHYVLGWTPVKPAAVPPKPAKKPVPRPTATPRGPVPSSLAPPL